MNIVQIGSHKGYDDLTNMVKSLTPEKVELLILIEPQKEFNDILSECYSGFNFFIENIVITNDENLKKCKFYSCEEDKNKEISSLNKEHLIKHNQNTFIEREFDCLTLNNLLIKYNIKKLDILFIDSEGFDGEIIKSINYDEFENRKMYYENLHINNNEIITFLENKNYTLNKNVLFNGWTNEAILNNIKNG